MKILVLSDSHGNISNMEAAVEREQPRMILHLGDCWRDAERLAAAGVQAREVLQKLLVELRAVLEIVGVDLAGGGQRQRRLGAVEQADAEFLFQMDDILAQIGLRDMQPLRGFRNAFLGRNGKKIFRISVLYHPDHLVFLFDYSKKYGVVKHGIVKML